MEINQTPFGAVGALNGLYYKIGRFGRLYYHNGAEWRTSNESCIKVITKIRNKINPMSLDDTRQSIFKSSQNSI